MQIVLQCLVKYWIQFLCAGFVGCFSFMFNKLAKLKKEDKAIKGAVLALLRDRINDSCKIYILQGHISSSDYQVLDQMFKEYFDMGGNGVIHRLYQEVKKLPIIVDK